MHKWRQYVDIGTYMQKTLSYALQGVIKTLRVKDDEFFKATGGRCWIVESAEEVISEIKSQPSSFNILPLAPQTSHPCIPSYLKIGFCEM
jgi:hypothetical protein